MKKNDLPASLTALLYGMSKKTVQNRSIPPPEERQPTNYDLAGLVKSLITGLGDNQKELIQALNSLSEAGRELASAIRENPGMNREDLGITQNQLGKNRERNGKNREESGTSGNPDIQTLLFDVQIEPDAEEALPKYSEEFEHAWVLYKRPDGKGSKLKAFQQWNKLGKTSRAAAVAGIPTHLKREFVKHFERYLRDRMWEDDSNEVKHERNRSSETGLRPNA